MSNIPWTFSYQKLGKPFYNEDIPQGVSDPQLIIANKSLAEEVGLSGVFKVDDDAAEFFSGNKRLAGAMPIAMAYSGHQFGHFSPQLGDGRAVLLGSLKTSSKIEIDIQLKGSGRTAYSRRGDGRSALGPVLREYILSEAMNNLGVSTTRALAAVTTGDEVLREGYLPGGIITRVSNSFVRVGSFQFFSSRNDSESVKRLADYVIARNYSDIALDENRYVNLLKAVLEKQAILIAKWMGLGFIHGVMNTDNMSICGETIDYGPCAFMDEFDFDKKFSYIDDHGRYAYSNQPQIALWNLSRFAESILSLLATEQDEAIGIAEQELNLFPELYTKYWIKEFSQKLGVANIANGNKEVKILADGLLNLMHQSKADFTQTFYLLSKLQNKESHDDIQLVKLFSSESNIKEWLIQWRLIIAENSIEEAMRQEQMIKSNPVIIPRNHQVEKVIRAAEDENDFEPFYRLNQVLETPFTYDKIKEDYIVTPTERDKISQTFCGT